MGQAQFSLFSHHSLMSSVFVKSLSSFCCSSGRSLLYLLCICKLLLNMVWFKWLWWHFIGSCWVLCVLVCLSSLIILLVAALYQLSGWIQILVSVLSGFYLFLYRNFLPEFTLLLQSYNKLLFSFFGLFNCGHHHCWLVVFSCGIYMRTAEKNVGLIFLMLQRHYWTLLSGWATCWRVVGWCECFTHPRVSV